MYFHKFLVSFLYILCDIRQCNPSEPQRIEINESGTTLLADPKIPVQQTFKHAFKESSTTGPIHNDIIRQPDDNSKQKFNEEVVFKRNHVREMMKQAWDVYVKYAWGYDEVKPVSKGVNDRHGSRVPMGTSIIDSMDTLYIMGLEKEFEKGRKWIEESFDFNLVDEDVSVFETNIRFVGG